jgi:hypothetical protein
MTVFLALLTETRVGRSSRISAQSLVWASLVLVVGCQDPRVTVSGKVTFAGKPLPGGLVAFAGPDNQVQTAYIQADGSYSVSDVKVGMNKVTVQTSQMITDGPPDRGGNAPESAAPFGGKAANSKGRFVPIPDRYAQASTSGLEIVVSAGGQTFNIPLEP